jgi:zinc D-Ala-D-Ala dipeptidase
MWEKYPVPGLIADPKTGSRHNRGSAIDLTLTDLEGNEIDMGTSHDDISAQSRTFYRGFNDTIFQNRMLLRRVMTQNHFIGINSEWWHFSHDCGPKYKVCDTVFCNPKSPLPADSIR